MESPAEPTYGRMRVAPEELDLAHTLTPGQSFRWRSDDLGRWTGVVGRKVVRIWREGPDLLFEMFPGPPDERVIRDYFRLEVSLADVLAGFPDDEHLSRAAARFPGLRVLRQDPEETLLSYACSPANSVRRIVTSIEEMCRRHGDLISVLDGREWYSFPTAERLLCAGPGDLAGPCGLCFRGRKLCSAASRIVERPKGWAASLRSASYDDARAELIRIEGIGPKIADCALLFSLDKDGACPADTHIRQVAARHYGLDLPQKSFTPRVYQQIVDFFQSRFGAYAGWAQEYLFYDDLLGRR